MSMKIRLLSVLLLASVAFAVLAGGASETVVLEPVLDATLFEDPDGLLANGAGDHLFTGYGNAPKRTLLEFDLSSLGGDAVIESAELTLFMSRTIVPGQTNRLHRVTTAWGEGASDAGGPEGTGTTSEPGDATWIHTFYPSLFWTSAGGDYAAMASAETIVLQDEGDYTWGSTPEMVADLQGWVDDPASNHGWILIGPENPLFKSAKRFDSRTHPDPTRRPRLSVTYTASGSGSGGVIAVPALDAWALALLGAILLGVGVGVLRR